jgi:hypothetical protein
MTFLDHLIIKGPFGSIKIKWFPDPVDFDGFLAFVLPKNPLGKSTGTEIQWIKI